MTPADMHVHILEAFKESGRIDGRTIFLAGMRAGAVALDQLVGSLDGDTQHVEFCADAIRELANELEEG